MAKQYEIVLNLRVNDQALDSALKKAKELEGAGTGAGVLRTRGTNRLAEGRAQYRNIRSGMWPGVLAAERIGRRMPAWLASTKNLRGSLDTLMGSWRKLGTEFARNATSVYGMRRNFVQFGKALSDTGRVLAKNIPAIGAAAAGAKAYLYAAGASAIGGGLLYGLGSKILNSNAVSEAAANITQYSAARKGLGPQYDATYNEATKIAATYGYSRAGIMSTVNTLTGIKYGESTIDTQQALDLSRIAGKISQASGRPYDIVALNMQQIMSASVANARDIREILHQAPLLNRLAREDMAQNGIKNTDPREWLKVPAAFLRVLKKFDEMIEPPAAMVARGRLKLAKENFWMGATQDLTPFFNAVAGAGEKMYSRIGDVIAKYMRGYNNDQIESLMNRFADTVGSLLNLGLKLVPAITGIANFLGKNPLAIGGTIAGMSMLKHLPPIAQMTISAAAVTVFGLKMLIDKANERAKEKEMAPALVKAKNYIEERREKEMALNYAKYGFSDYATMKAAVGSEIPEELIRKVAETYAYQTIGREERNFWQRIKLSNTAASGIGGFGSSMPGVAAFMYGPKYKDINGWSMTSDTSLVTQQAINSHLSGFSPAGNTGADGANTNPNTDISNVLEKMSEMRRSVIINFNKEIVSMPTNIYATDTDDIAAQLEPKIEDVVTRGLQLAIINATPMR